MIRSRLGRVVRVTIPLILVVVVTSVVTLSAQGNPALNQIMAQLGTIIEMLTPPPPPAGPVTLSTSAILVPAGDFVACVASNIGTESVRVELNLLDRLGNWAGTVFDDTLVPGETGRVFNGGTGDWRRCEFIVHGNAAVIRANMMVTGAAGITISEAR